MSKNQNMPESEIDSSRLEKLPSYDLVKALSMKVWKSFCTWFSCLSQTQGLFFIVSIAYSLLITVLFQFVDVVSGKNISYFAFLGGGAALFLMLFNFFSKKWSAALLYLIAAALFSFSTVWSFWSHDFHPNKGDKVFELVDGRIVNGKQYESSIFLRESLYLATYDAFSKELTREAVLFLKVPKAYISSDEMVLPSLKVNFVYSAPAQYFYENKNISHEQFSRAIESAFETSLNEVEEEAGADLKRFASIAGKTLSFRVCTEVKEALGEEACENLHVKIE